MAGKGSYVYICENCKGKFPFEEIRYGPDGKRIFCVSCRDKIAKGENKPEGYSATKEPTLIKLICTACNYRFSLKKGTKVRLRCPYCGKERLIKDNLTTEKLIEEVSGMK